MTKAIALLSGGLDSILAAKLMLEQSIELEALNFLTVFCNCTTSQKTCLASKSAADQLNIPLKVFEVSQEYFSILKNPKHGYGKNLNPCLDCRIFIFKKAKEYMRSQGASFIITGEVLGERPMSQRKAAMDMIERESDLDGLILRPLSAKLFEPTIPEKEGLVDREKLLNIQGRCRKPQIALAKDLGINDYPCPSGGCLLTYKQFADKMRDLIEHKPDFVVNDVQLLKSGRIFRLSPKAILAVGRDEGQNKQLIKLCKEDDICFKPFEIVGPIGIGRGELDDAAIKTASSIIARYSDKDGEEPAIIEYRAGKNKEPKTIKIEACREETLISLRK